MNGLAARLDPRSKAAIWLSMIATGLLLPAGPRLAIYVICLLGFISPLAGCLRASIAFGLKVILPTIAMLALVYGLLAPPGEAQPGFAERIVAGVLTGAFIGARLMAIAVATLAFVATTRQMEFASCLCTLGIPSWLAAVFVSSFNMHAVVIRKTRQIVDAQRARGLKPKGILLGRIRMYAPILRPLLFGMILSAIERSALWQTRGYIEVAGRRQLRFRRPDAWALGFALFLPCSAGVLRWAI